MRELLEYYKVLSDETRLRILCLLNVDELCVCQMSGILNLPQPKVSRHITRMRHLGLIKDRRQDKFVFYSLNKDKPEFNQILKTALQVSLKDETLINDKLALKDKERYIEELCKL